MHILFLTDNFPPEVNAAANRVYERAVHWVKWGHTVTVITCAPNFPKGKLYPGYKNKWYQTETIDGIQVVRVKTFMAPNKGFTLRIIDFLSYMIMAVIAGLFQKKPDVIIATSPQFFTAVGGWLLSTCKRSPFIFELGDLWPAAVRSTIEKPNKKIDKILDLFEKLELFLYKRAKVIIALTDAFKNNLIGRNIAADKIQVIINGVNLDFYQPESKDMALSNELSLENYFVIGYIGTIGLAHDLSNVLRAAQILQQQNQPIKFVFLGEGAEKEDLMELAKKLALTNVTFIDQKPKSETKKYWSICDVALVHLKDDPIYETVIPSKIFEAMAMAKPILYAGPDNEGSKIISQTDTGVCIPSNNPEILAEAAIKLAQDTAQITVYRNNSEMAAKKFSRETQAKKVILALETLK